METSKLTSNMEAGVWGLSHYILVFDRTSRDQLHSKIKQTDGKFDSQQK